MITVIPISGTLINWQTYVKEVERLIGRSPTRSLDSSRMSVGGVESFLASIGEFKQAGTNPYRFLESYPPEANHLHLGFLCELDNDTFVDLVLCTASRLMITECSDTKKRVFIISGTLADWRICLAHKQESLEDFYSIITEYFKEFGFRHYFT